MRARPLTTALLATGLLLSGCGDGDDQGPATVSGSGPAATSAPADAGSDAPGALVFPAGFGLPELTVPDGARVVDYSVTDDLTFDVSELADVAAVLDAMQAELAAAGFQVDRTDGGGLGVSVTASKAGAGTVLVQESGEGSVTVLGRPPA